MNRSILMRVVLKDLYLQWPMLAGSLLLGFAMLALALFGGGPITFYVGSVSFLCVLVLLNVLLISSTVAQEKKDRVLILIVPRLLNYIVAIYLIITGVLGLFPHLR